MPNKNYLRGRRLEWEVKKKLEADGFHVIRASGSHGVFDLVAVKKTDRPWIKFIQCKVMKDRSKTKTKALLKEFRENSPIKSSYLDDHYIDVELIVKYTGEGNYTVNPLES